VAELFRDDTSISWGFGINSGQPPLVTAVHNGGVAADAGVLPGDVIVFIDNFDTINNPIKATVAKLKAAGGCCSSPPVAAH
jgi:C-terminal processing protease CtpA/Prc